MGPSRFEEALRKADARIMPTASTSSSSPSAPNTASSRSTATGKRKRIVLPPPQLVPDILFGLDFDPDRDQSPPRKRPAVPGPFPGRSPQRDDSPEPVGDTSMEEVEAQLELPELSIEAQLEALRARGAPDLFQDDAIVHDIDRNAAPDQAEEVVRFFQEQSKKQPQAHTVQEALENIGMEEAGDLLPGLDVRLLPHQIVGLSWMLNKERNHREMGGILADDMGLGKTVQAIALMILNQPELGEPGQRQGGRYQTLIVAPAALLDQWKDEIETKADMFRVFIHHGPKKAKNAEALRKYEVVITSYTTMLYDVQPRSTRDRRGPLSKTKWYRIILDEAQIIRNRNAQSSIASAMLDSTYRWLLTGTPFTNGLPDLYPLLRFARLRPWNDWDTFKIHIGNKAPKDAETATAKMAVIVKKHLLRRRKDDMLDGRPLLQLKPKHIEMVLVDLSPEERKIYDAVEKRQQQTITRFLRAGTLIKNYQFVLVMILRLRQVCCHPQLIAYAAEDLAAQNAEAVLGAPIGYEDGEGGGGRIANDITAARAAMGPEMVKKLQAMLKERARVKLDRVINKLPAPDHESDDECPICTEVMGNARITVCGHRFCHDCIEGHFNNQINYQRDDEAGIATRPCPMCRHAIREDQLFRSSLFEPNAAELRSMKVDIRQARKKKKKRSQLKDESDDDLPELDWWQSKPKTEVKEKKPKREKSRSIKAAKEEFVDLTLDDDDDLPAIFSTKRIVPDVKGKGKAFLIDSSDSDSSSSSSSSLDEALNPFKANMLDEVSDFENSAKMNSMMDLLKQWREETPDDKVVIYSQWTKCIDLLEGALERESFRSLRYDGQMDREERSSVIKRFKKHGGPNILIVSLKCGGVGLNLVEANRVICFDPAWNYATESQAYDRVHRIGQQKEVFVNRLIARDTIEERVLRIQQGKTDLTNAALGEGTGGRIRRLGVGDILGLFNMHR